MKDRGYSVVALHMPKTPANVGSAMRACGVYGASALIQSGNRFPPGRTDAAKMHRRIPLIRTESLRESIPFDCIPVGVDLVSGAKSLFSYRHPERAMYIFGPEDGTLDASILDWCRDVVYIPTPGPCMNLAAAVNVVLYDRIAKQSKEKE